ncbi:hypothetical protein [Lignipirellula cremea]|uniref:hypothetical protein n=1 Tax=Lignipirellula cremea TaxID=2528010 RepID=UPI0018D26214|nr:hypothetical protein [Lignipirellula cremea]
MLVVARVSRSKCRTTAHNPPKRENRIVVETKLLDLARIVFPEKSPGYIETLRYAAESIGENLRNRSRQSSWETFISGRILDAIELHLSAEYPLVSPQTIELIAG